MQKYPKGMQKLGRGIQCIKMGKRRHNSLNALPVCGRVFFRLLLMICESLPDFNFFVFTIDDLPVYKNLTNLTKRRKMEEKFTLIFGQLPVIYFCLWGMLWNA